MKIFLDDVRSPVGNITAEPDEWLWVKTAPEAFNLIVAGGVEEISLDHDLGDGQPTGYDLCKWIMEVVFKKRLKSVPLMSIHSMNPVGAENMNQMIKTIRRLVDDGGEG